MKNYFPFLTLVFIFSCKSSIKQPTTDTTSTSKAAENSNFPIEKFKPLLQGTWVKKAYIDRVAETRSPLTANDAASGITVFSIDTALLKDNSIVVQAGWGNYDGSELNLTFKAGKKPSSIVFGDGEITVSINQRDTILTVYYPDPESKKVSINQFIRANSQQVMQISYGLDRAVNKVLMAGDYTLLDSTNVKSKVEFKLDGQIKGFNNFKTYSVNLIFNSGPMSYLDEISFDADGNNGKAYSFKFDADTLKLYDIKPNADSALLVLGRLRYKLVKLK